MILLGIAFLAGALTVLAPCILPVLPIVLGGSFQGGSQRRWAPYIIVTSLAFSVVVFTLLLKVSTAAIAIPDTFWKIFSGGVISIFGLAMVFPGVWQHVRSILPQGAHAANRMLAQGTQRHSVLGDILVGAVLGPVFSSCSPTYFVIVGIVLPQSLAAGLMSLLAYAAGLAIVLLAIALLGRRVVARFAVLANPQGWFKKGLGVLFLVVGMAIITGMDKKVEASLLQSGVYSGVDQVEQYLLDYGGL